MKASGPWQGVQDPDGDYTKYLRDPPSPFDRIRNQISSRKTERKPGQKTKGSWGGRTTFSGRGEGGIPPHGRTRPGIGLALFQRR